MKSDQNIEKLSALFTELPKNLCHTFISDRLVHSIIQEGKDATSLIDFGSSFNLNFDWSLENFWTPLRLVLHEFPKKIENSVQALLKPEK